MNIMERWHELQNKAGRHRVWIIACLVLVILSGISLPKNTYEDKTMAENDGPECQTGVINTDAVKLRSAADPDAQVMVLLNEGIGVKILAVENGFYHIAFQVQGRDEELTGYVKMELVRLVQE